MKEESRYAFPLTLSTTGKEARVNWREGRREEHYKEEERVYGREEQAFFLSLCAMEDTVGGPAGERRVEGKEECHWAK